MHFLWSANCCRCGDYACQMPATCTAPQVCSTECTAMRRRDYMRLCVKCCSGILPVQGDSMCSAAVSSNLPSCICLCYDSVCTLVVYCIDSGCYFCISVYMLQVQGSQALQNWRLCRLYICNFHCSNAYVCLSVCSNSVLHVARYKSVKWPYNIEMKCWASMWCLCWSMIMKAFSIAAFGPAAQPELTNQWWRSYAFDAGWTSRAFGRKCILDVPGRIHDLVLAQRITLLGVIACE